MLNYLRNVYYLSFPVVVGAVLSNRMASRLSDVEPVHWATPIVLALVVFIIYTVDRLLDIRKPNADYPNQPLTARHQFHRTHAQVLWRVVIGATSLAFVLTFFLPGSVVKFGIVLGGICAAYVGAVFRLPARHPALLLKEPLVAMLYAAGVWGSVWVQRPSVSSIEIAEGLMFLGIAFQNLILFAVMEQLETPDQSLFSLATAWGLDSCDLILRWLTFVIVLTGFALCFITTDRFAQRSALMLALMSLTLYGIQRYPDYFLRNERYRWLGDGVFWMPILVL
ncbi:UbiA prenyltransferase family protein [Spirosoma flavum]|uniref:UbiA family prenyltransferase n=1 Tax=Spirosoma flavum TaxID=2048557 RepID=A0ABW6AFA6_9BACT